MRMMMVLMVMGLCVLPVGVVRAEVPAIAHVEEVGAGETALVLIHDTQGDWRVWGSFMERNAGRYRMLAVRLAGAGGSEAMGLPEGDPVDEMVWSEAAVAGLVDALDERGVERLYVIGHGLGATIGMTLAIEHPDRVAGVVLVDAMPAYPLTLDGYRMPQLERALYIGNGFAPVSAAYDPEEWKVRWSALAARQVQSEDGAALLYELADEIDLPVWRRWTIEQHTPDLTDALRESGVRVLGMGTINPGKMNYFQTRTMVEEFWYLGFDDVPGSDLTLFDETRHYVFLDRPGAFDSAVGRFVAGEAQPEYSYREVEEPDGVEGVGVGP